MKNTSKFVGLFVVGIMAAAGCSTIHRSNTIPETPTSTTTTNICMTNTAIFASEKGSIGNKGQRDYSFNSKHSTSNGVKTYMTTNTWPSASYTN